MDAGLSDKEIFDALPLNDPWEDARMLQVFDYLMSHPRTTVPASWENSMMQFHQQLRDLVQVSEPVWQEYAAMSPNAN